MAAKLKRIGWLISLLLCHVLKAQLPLPVRGPCGTSAIVAGVVNTYYPGLNNVNAGDATILLGPSIGNPQPLLQGDRILIIQVQDATINAVNSPAYGGNGTGGNGYIDLGFSGQYEFAQVASFAAGVLSLVNPLQFSYRAVSGIPNRKSSYQVVRVPTFTNVILGGAVMAAPWDGTAGGVVAFHAWQMLDMNGNDITATGLGFRPGRINSAGGAYNLQDYCRVTYGSFGEKGEGIAGTSEGTWAATAGGYENGSFARGAPANAGGGGNAHNSGGGGAANFGDGGKGGYQYGGPEDVGGRGGVGVKTALPGRIIMGGGGGGGHQNNSAATGGGHGGGIIIITANTITGAGAITNNGIDAGPSTDDGAGGGGAGGSIVLAYTGALPAGITISARGGNGGNEAFIARHGCGGGAGGGVIITSTPVAGVNVAGGIRGLSNGTEWGAIDGQPGTVRDMDLSPLFPTSTLIPSLQVKADTTVCAPTTVDLGSPAIITSRDQGPQYTVTYWRDAVTTIPVANPQAINQSGTYYIRLYNTNTSCERVAAVQVTVHPQPVLTLRINDTTVCAPATVDITSSAIIAGRDQGQQFSLTFWEDAAISIPVANPQAVSRSGTYYIRLTNTTTGCDTISPVQVTINPLPVLTLGVNDTAVCAPATVDLTSPAIITNRDQGPQYVLSFWTDAATTIPAVNPRAIDQSGTYYIRLSNARTGCDTVAAVRVTVHPQPIVTLRATPPSCTGSSNASITPMPGNGAGPYQYSSNGGLSWQDTIASHLPAGTYTILARDNYGCVSQPASIVITDPPLLTLREEASAHADVLCNGMADGRLRFTAAGGTNGYLYTIISTETGEISNSSGTFTGLPAGNYTVSVTDGAQCSRQTETVIQQPPPLSLMLASKTDLDCDAHPRGSITLRASGGVAPYWYRLGEGGWQRDSIFGGLAAGTHYLVVRDGNDCVTAPLAAEVVVEEGCEVIFPNAFTPNGDGLNDIFRPKYYSRVSNYRLTVYNRWGAVAFQSNDPALGWNGQIKGVLSETGTFVWIATFTNRRGQAQTMRGTVTLVK